MHSFQSIARLSKGFLPLLTGVALGFGCNNVNKSGLTVAGGKIDGANGAAMRYPGTVYVELDGIDFNNQKKLIRNVGTLVNLGDNDNLALFLSLADSFTISQDRDILPLFKTVTLKLFLSDRDTNFSIPGMSFSNAGILRDKNGKAYKALSVGVKVEKIGPSQIPDAKVRDMAQKLFLPSPLMAKGTDFRVPITTYMIIAVPRDAHPSLSLENLQAPTITFAEDRALEANLKKLEIAGFGEMDEGDKKDGTFSLSASLPNILKRNYASVTALNKDPTKVTPLRKTISDETVSKQLWEIGGSGICGSSDGQNYDTGASLYQDGKFLGFAVRSSANSADFKGVLDCKKTSREDMVTIIVSPSKSEVTHFLNLK